MCDYCGCRSLPAIEDLGADHEELLVLADRVRREVRAGSRATAHTTFDLLLDRLRVHTEAEEASVFAALQAAGELLAEVEELKAEHAAVLAAAACLPETGWDEGVLALLDDLQAHIAREEYDVFPAAWAVGAYAG